MTLLRLPCREFYRMPPGLLYDMIQLHTQRYGPKKGAADE